MGTKQEVLLDDDLDLEKGFNDAVDDLRKSLNIPAKGEESEEELEKAGKVPPQLQANAKKMKAKASDEEEPEEEDEEEEEEDEYRKSIEDTLREEPEAAAAMDVEPFLLQLAKAIDESQESGAKATTKRLDKIESMVKSIGRTVLAAAELQKSTRDMVKSIGETPIPARGITSLKKARFSNPDGSALEFAPRDVLAKSRDWVKTGKVNLVEAGNIEARVNKGLLGRVNDQLDQKVAALMREAS